MSSPPVYLATGYTLDHYVKAFKLWNAWPYIINSLVISLASTAIILLLSVPAAYAIAKYSSGGTKFKTWTHDAENAAACCPRHPAFSMLNKVMLIDTYQG